MEAVCSIKHDCCARGIRRCGRRRSRRVDCPDGCRPETIERMLQCAWTAANDLPGRWSWVIDAGSGLATSVRQIERDGHYRTLFSELDVPHRFTASCRSPVAATVSRPVTGDAEVGDLERVRVHARADAGPPGDRVSPDSVSGPVLDGHGPDLTLKHTGRGSQSTTLSPVETARV